MKKIFKNTKGFTLVEIIVVVAIIAVLTVSLLLALNPFYQFQKARDAQRKSDLSQIAKALENYYQDNGRYPSSTGSPNYCMQDSKGTSYCGGSQWGDYMNLVPADPASNRRYVYYSPVDGQSFYLYASLERAGDPKMCTGGVCTGPGSVDMTTACGAGGKCNFGVTSPNVTP